MNFRAAALSDIGRVRERNEDRCLLDHPLGVFGVADGVGGLPGGAEAAQAAHDSFLQEFRAGHAAGGADLRRIAEAADRAVAEQGRTISPATGIATTLTVGAFRGSRATLLHIGDSRCYRWGGGLLHRLTQDHHIGQALSRCLGQPKSGPAEIAEMSVQPGERFLFCTDGLTLHVSDGEIAVAMKQPEPPDVLLRRLVSLALGRGGRDNISGVLVFAEAK